MYIVEFIKSLRYRGSITLVIWLVLNIMIIVSFFSGFFALIPMSMGIENDWVIGGTGIICSLLIYAISLAIALSDFGERSLRRKCGAKPIKDQEVLRRIMPLFNEVYSRAKWATPGISEDIKLFITDDEDVNAFATGRKTICITKGLLSIPDAEIKGVLAHEFGHIAHKDTDALQFVFVGNVIVSIGASILSTFMYFMSVSVCAAFKEGLFGYVMGHFFKYTVGPAIMWLWGKIGELLVLRTGRANEYLADQYAYTLGYGRGLCNMLYKYGDTKSHGVFAILSSTHPATEDRIAKLTGGTALQLRTA